jgi:hypothetical protein
MVAQLLQKLRSEVHFSSLGVPRSLTATYFLTRAISNAHEKGRGGILDQVLAFGDFQRISYPAQVDTAAVPAALPTDRACAELVRHWRVGLESELDTTALAASLECPIPRLSTWGLPWPCLKHLHWHFEEVVSVMRQ